MRDNRGEETLPQGECAIDEARHEGDDKAVMFKGEEASREQKGAPLKGPGGNGTGQERAVKEAAEEEFLNGRNDERTADEARQREEPSANGRIIRRGRRRLGLPENAELRVEISEWRGEVFGQDPERENDEAAEKSPKKR